MDIIEEDETLRNRTRPLIIAISQVRHEQRVEFTFKSDLWFLIVTKGHKLIP